MNAKARVTRYTPPPIESSAGRPSLYVVSSTPSQGVGVDATSVAELFSKLTEHIDRTETLTRALLEQLDQDSGPIDYKHLEGKFVRTVNVRYRNVGRLPVREVAFDDIDE